MINDPSQLDNLSAQLVAEQFSHAVDLLKAETRRQAEKITSLEEQAKDFETRIRDLTDAATQFKFLASLAMGGGALSIIALIKVLISP
jgi:methyl-accepting chemotaxis protein